MAQEAQQSADIVYFGNPIFDITINDPQREVCNQYGLEMATACLASPEQMPIFQQLWNREDKLTGAGGSALNAARAQKHTAPEGSVAYFGCIGNDEIGQTLSQFVSDTGIITKLEVTQEEPTGQCACVIVNRERTMCANIAAAKKFSMGYLNANIVSNL